MKNISPLFVAIVREIRLIATGAFAIVGCLAGAQFAYAAALTSTNVEPTTLLVGATNAVTVMFTTASIIPLDGAIVVTFGSGYTVSSASSPTCSTMDGSFSLLVSSQTVTISRSGGTPEPAGAQICTIAIVRNPTSVGSTGTYAISTTTSSAVVIDTDAAVGSDNIRISTSEIKPVVTSLTYDISIATPVVTTAYTPGDIVEITWSTVESTGTVAAVNLAYSTDGGITYTSIASGTSNDGSYTWAAPDINEQSVTIRAQATDLIVVLDTDTSDAFSIGTEASDETSEDTSDDTTAEDTDTSSESTNLLPTGTFFKGESWDTVYYVDGTTRRPFLDAQTFFTYADNFDAVIDASDDYLANYTIGTPMLPMAGSVLVKVQSLNKVYALGEDGELRWVSSESLASSLYGSNWADYVIDVPVTAWGHFTIGDDINSVNEIEVDDSILQTRDELNSMSV